MSQCSEGWKSKIKVLAGLIPSEGCEGRVAQAPLFDSEGLVFILHLFTLSPGSVCTCACGPVSLFHKDTGLTGLGPTFVTSF